MARNLYGIIPIKVRAKDSSTLDLSSVTSDDLIIDGNINSAKGGKLVLLDVFIEDANDDSIRFNGITQINEFGYVEVIAFNTLTTPTICYFAIFNDGSVNISEL